MCLAGEEDIGVGGMWIMGCEMEMAMDRELRRGAGAEETSNVVDGVVLSVGHDMHGQ
jgi:hypothetical protein